MKGSDFSFVSCSQLSHSWLHRNGQHGSWQSCLDVGHVGSGVLEKGGPRNPISMGMEHRISISSQSPNIFPIISISFSWMLLIFYQIVLTELGEESPLNYWPLNVTLKMESKFLPAIIFVKSVIWSRASSYSFYIIKDWKMIITKVASRIEYLRKILTLVKWPQIVHNIKKK